MTSKAILALAAVTATATADPLYDELLVCRGLPDDARLYCYDAAVDRSRRGTSGRPPAAPAAVGSEPAADSATAAAAAITATNAAPPTTAADAAEPAGNTDISQEDLFGKDQDEIERTVEEVTGTERIDSLSGTIARLQKSGYDKVVITLDNGQVWKQVDASSLRLRVGDAVEIERAVMGSFLLQKKGSKRTMRVSRQQ